MKSIKNNHLLYILICLLLLLYISQSIPLLDVLREGVDEEVDNSLYIYGDNIKDPKKINITKNGSWDSLKKNISGLNSYVDLLVSGNSKAAVGSKPLGNKFFVNTEYKCASTDGSEQERYLYIDNVPKGSFKGLIPGALEKITDLDISELTNVFSDTSGDLPECQEITMETRDQAHNIVNKSHYVATQDIEGISPCSFGNRVNPITGDSCETFSNLHNKPSQLDQPSYPYNNIPDQPLIKLYFGMIGLSGLYIIYCVLRKKC